MLKDPIHKVILILVLIWFVVSVYAFISFHKKPEKNYYNTYKIEGSDVKTALKCICLKGLAQILETALHATKKR